MAEGQKSQASHLIAWSWYLAADGGKSPWRRLLSWMWHKKSKNLWVWVWLTFIQNWKSFNKDRFQENLQGYLGKFKRRYLPWVVTYSPNFQTFNFSSWTLVHSYWWWKPLEILRKQSIWRNFGGTVLARTEKIAVRKWLTSWAWREQRL